MIELGNVLLTNLLVIAGFMFLLWIVSLVLKNSSIVDIFWGAGFVLVTWVSYMITNGTGFEPRRLLGLGLVTMWGLRLSLYILWRNWRKGEDSRYQAWRREAGRRWWWQSLFQVFLLQGILMWIISIPLALLQASPVEKGFTLLDGAGVFLWAVGFFFEAAGDWQLARFRQDPANRGKVLDRGVWRYTRHPNYFGDATQWWGYFLLASAVGGWWTLFSPALMTVLLLRVSGVALLEKSLEQRPGYREYVARTSAFLPWPPKKNR